METPSSRRAPSEKEIGGPTDIYATEDEVSPEELARDRALVRKIDWHVMPLLMITYGIQYSDKISLSSGAIFDLRQDTKLVGAQYPWLSTIFYLAYLVAELPVAWLMQRYRIDRILAYLVCFWGVLVLALAGCNDFKSLMAVRALLGAGESAVSPGFLIIVSAWYKREEQITRSMAFFAMNSFFSLWVLMCCYGLGKATYMKGGLEAWRVINLFLGALSLVWGIVMVWKLGTPATVSWLSSEEKELLRVRLLSNKDGETESGVKIKWPQVWECFRDPQMYFQVIFIFLISIVSGGIVAFAAIIVSSFGFGNAESLALQLPWYFITFCCIILCSWILQRWPKKNWILLIGSALMCPSLVGVFMQGLLPQSQRWARLAGYYLTGPYVVNQFLLMSTVAQNTAGRTKKSMIQALTFISYCVGFLVGPQFFWASSAPQYRPGLYTMAACFVLAEVILITWYIWARSTNRARDRAVEAMGLTAEQQEAEGRRLGELDMTDRENPHFRYRY